MLPCVCSVIDHRRRQNVVRTSVTPNGSCATFLLSPHFDVNMESICETEDHNSNLSCFLAAKNWRNGNRTVKLHKSR